MLNISFQRASYRYRMVFLILLINNALLAFSDFGWLILSMGVFFLSLIVTFNRYQLVIDKDIIHLKRLIGQSPRLRADQIESIAIDNMTYENHRTVDCFITCKDKTIIEYDVSLFAQKKFIHMIIQFCASHHLQLDISKYDFQKAYQQTFIVRSPIEDLENQNSDFFK